MSIFWIVLAALAMAGLQGLIFGRFNLKRLEYRRYFSRPRVFEGESLEMVEVLRNRKPLPVPWLRIESRISPFLRFTGRQGDERSISADQYHRSLFFLPPFSQIVRRHSVKCLKRGQYQVSSAAITAGDLFALSRKSRQVDLNCQVTVYPRLLEQEFDLPSSRWQGDVTVRRFIQPDPFLVAGIRDYMPGDAMRDVHWAATARTGSLKVKQRDYTADPRLMVLLNVQMTEEQWGDLMEYEQEIIEQGIRLAATLCVKAVECGMETGFGCNGSLENQSVLVPARNGRDQIETLLTVMARMTLHREMSFNTFLDRLVDLTGADILVLSAYDSPSLRAGMARLAERGNSVQLRLLEGGEGHAQGMGAD